MSQTKITSHQIKNWPFINVQDYGVTPASLNTALALASEVLFPPGTYNLGTTALQIPANTKVKCMPGAIFHADTSVVANMPEAYFVANGDDIEIDGVYLDFVATPYVAYAANGALIRVAANSNRIKIHNCRSNYVIHSVYSNPTDNDITQLSIYDNNFNSVDGDIALIGLRAKDISIDNNDFPIQQFRGYWYGGRIQIHPGWNPANPYAGITQAWYDNDYCERVTITNNRMYRPGIRPVRLTNIKDLVISGNDITTVVGNYDGTDWGVCDDLYTLNFIRGFTVWGNTNYGGGENGIDLLSCQHGVVDGNTWLMGDSVSIITDFAEQYIADTTHNPQLQAITDRTVLINRDIVISNNICQAMFPLEHMNGQGITWIGNKVSKNPVASPLSTANWVPLSSYDGATHVDRFMAESRNHWWCDLLFKDNTADMGMPMQMSYSGVTNVCTTTTPHQMVTGDKIHFTIGGTNPTSVSFPTGIFYAWDYYAIVTGPTTLKVAASYANALAGTAEALVTTGPAAPDLVYVQRKCPQPAYTWNINYMDYNANIVFEENIPNFQLGLLSTFVAGGITTGSNWVYKNIKVELIADPAADYSAGGLKSHTPKLLPVPMHVTSNGVNTAGVELTHMAVNAITIIKGAVVGRLTGMAADGYVKVSYW